MSPELLIRSEPLPPAVLKELSLNPKTATVVQLEVGRDLYNMVTAHLCKIPTTRSFTMEIVNGSRKSGGNDEADQCRVANKDLGLGIFSFTFNGKAIHAFHQTLGEVVGTDCGPALMKSLFLCADSSNCERDVDLITRFCDELITKADETSDKTFSIYRWHVQHHYWHKVEVAKARSVESVVLPAELKAKLVDDMAEFASPLTREWYIEHGVPYKRSYLLHGSPGAGKTSVIQALAGRFQRNVCFMSSLSHPEMTDDNLKQAVQRVPPKSILVLEDIDALFCDGRKKRDGDKSALTFSGVLNALDGVGASSGQIFILTTNHRERLDPALIRNGRVDTHIEFTDATPEQMSALFLQFYKAAPPELGQQFSDELCKLLGEHTVSMAALQHYFTAMRRQPAEAAVREVQRILEEAAAHGMKLSKKVADGDAAAAKAVETLEKEVEGKEEKEEKGEAEDEETAPPKRAKSGKAGGATRGGKEVHVHVHVD